MTDAQIRFSQLLETKRHNLRTEELTKYATDTQAQTSRYATDVSAQTARHVAQVNAQTSRYVADTSARTQLTTAQLSADTSRYATDKQAQTSVYKTDVESADRRLRLQFEQQTQMIQNKLNREKQQLETFRAMSTARLNEAQVRKLSQDIQNSIYQLELNARSVGLNEQAAKFQNELTRARTAESYFTSAEKAAKTLDTVWNIVQKVIQLAAG